MKKLFTPVSSLISVLFDDCNLYFFDLEPTNRYLCGFVLCFWMEINGVERKTLFDDMFLCGNMKMERKTLFDDMFLCGNM